jgi:hypothetical protein
MFPRRSFPLARNPSNRSPLHRLETCLSVMAGGFAKFRVNKSCPFARDVPLEEELA